MLSLLCAAQVTAEGQPQVTTSLSTNYCTLGDSVTLIITATPAAEYSCKSPDLKSIPAFNRAFTTVQNRADTEHIGNSITYTCMITPTKVGISEIPPIPITFTDKQSGKSYLIYSSPIPIQTKTNIKKPLNLIHRKSQTIAPITTNQNVSTHNLPPPLLRQPIITTTQHYLWGQANSEMSSATTEEAFLKAAQTYQTLISTGARTEEIYYNLGTTLLHANRPNDAWNALLRAERYIGGKSIIRYNMAIAINMLPEKNLTSWSRLLFPWHFKLAINTRLYIALLSLIVLFILLWVIYRNSNKTITEYRNTLLTFTVILFVSFSSSLFTSAIAEYTARTREESTNHITHTLHSKQAPTIPLYMSPNDTDQSRTTDNPTTNQYKENKSTVATLTSDIATPYINQNFTLTLTVTSIAPLGNEIEINNLPPKHILHRDPFKELSIKYTQVDGKMQETHQYICLARAEQAGTLTLAPTLQVTQLKKKNRKTINISAKTLQLTMKPLPLYDSSKLFSGAIGQFSMQTKTFPTNATPNDLIKITTTINGEGYIPEKYLPRISYAENFILYDPTLLNISKNKKIFEQFIIPLPLKTSHIPSTSFTYFDPSLARYTTCTNKASPLKYSTTP